MAQSAIIIGQYDLCRRLEHQLDAMADRPQTIGWILTDSIQHTAGAKVIAPVLGVLADLESILARGKPDIALLTLPAVMKDQIAALRTRLRKLGIPDRFIPTMEDLVAGVGPRTHLDIDLSQLLNRPPRQIDERSVRAAIQSKRVLITGAGGSIGGELARIVAGFDPAALILVERAENALFEIDRQIARSHPHLARKALLHDVVDERGTFAHFQALQPQVIFHAAAHKHVPMMEDHPAAAIENNVFGTKSVADAADAIAAERFVMISTDKAVNPSSVMGATKRIAELYVQFINQRSATAFSIVRFGNVLGSAGSVLETWSRQIADGGPITVTDPRMTRYFMTIPEAAALVIQSAALVRKVQSPDHQSPNQIAGSTLDFGELEGKASRHQGIEGSRVNVSISLDASMPRCVDPLMQDGADVFLLDMGEPIRILELACRFIELHGLSPLHPGKASTHDGIEESTANVSLSLDASMPRCLDPLMGATSAHAPAGTVRIEVTGIRPGEKLHEKLAVDGEQMRPTAHPDIRAWLLPRPDKAHIQRILKRLHAMQANGATGLQGLENGPETAASALAGEILRLVPESTAAAAA